MSTPTSSRLTRTPAEANCHVIVDATDKMQLTTRYCIDVCTHSSICLINSPVLLPQL
uniref:Uncharacterized protein n=1 Tax=Triticum urartu TaxID=4572 RepID=A0A8R7PIY1_TRIUA